METKTKAKLLAGVAGVGVVALGAWSVASALRVRDVERVPYRRVDEVDGVELRRYPETVRVRTTAPTQGAAFRRLFRYIDGENAGPNGNRNGDGTKVAMTTPVETDDAEREESAESGEEIAMTAPVETGEAVSMTAPVETGTATGGTVTMSFFLPEEYTPETAPEPTNPEVELVVDPPRTLAVRSFSWWAPGFRVAREEDALRGTLDETGIEVVGEPTLQRYDAPFTPPFMRTNEVAVEVDSESVREALTGER